MKTIEEFNAIHNLLDAVYDLHRISGRTKKEFAELAGIHPTTLRRLMSYKTMYPRIQTVFMLAQAVGFTLVLGPVRKPKMRKAS